MKISFRRKEPAFSFVIEELENSKISASLSIKAIFGSHAVYLGNKIFLILRHKEDSKTRRDNGLWIAISENGAESLISDFPFLRPIELFAAKGRKGFSDWLNLPEESASFEEDAIRIAQLIIKSDSRLGKLPKSKAPKIKVLKKK